MLESIRGKKFLVVARDYMSRYLEARALAYNLVVVVYRFLEEVVFLY